jgi:hypothetical protein
MNKYEIPEQVWRLIGNKILQEEPFDIKYRREPERIHAVKLPWRSRPPLLL